MRLVRSIASLQSQYTLKVAKIQPLIELGRMLLRLSVRTHQPVSYGLHYLAYGNPQYLRIVAPNLMVSEDETLGLQSLASAKGGESKHASTKLRILSDTNGHADWPEQHTSVPPI